MANKGTLGNITGFCIIIFMCFAFYGCGTQGSLVGGPKDSIPPTVIKMLPKNYTTNFKEDKIEIEFDEFFKIENQAKEFSVSPEFEIQPTLKVKKKILEISFQDSLEKNTTYTLNFGKSIADINESNHIKNFTYVFSTGPKLDSLSLSGKVTNAKSGLAEIEAVVMIYALNRDTVFGKKKASIYTTTDSSGNYRLNNLREDTYRIYAIKEQNGDKIYQQATDEVGFLKDSIVLNANKTNVDLQVFKEDAAVFRVNDRKLNNDGSIFLSLNQRLKKPGITIIEPGALDANKLVKFNQTNDSLKLWLKDMSFDSLKVSISDEGKALDTIKFSRGKKDVYTRTIVATDNLEEQLLNPNKPLRLTFNLPVENVDLTKITLTEDSISRSGISITRDSLDFLSYVIRYPWVAKRDYEISFAEGAFTGIFNSKSKAFTKNLKLNSKDNYGTLNLKVLTTDKGKQYILQVIDEKENIISTSSLQNDTTLTFTNYKAGKYFVRIIYDANKNGKWDTGNLKSRTFPEKIHNEPKELSIKANWDRNETITIPKEPEATGTSPST